MVARAWSRRSDVAVRAAVGAGRGRLVRESVTEGVLLAGMGGAAGLTLALLVDDLVAALF
jgi:ABC-type antimicrobial peptide transport system permease subunit